MPLSTISTLLKLQRKTKKYAENHQIQTLSDLKAMEDEAFAVGVYSTPAYG
jgi:hypothetical protein